jgi:predicted dehydrogenase
MTIGIIGCGNISTTYLSLAPLFRGCKVVAVADANMEAARARGAEYGVAAQTVEALLGNPEVRLVINLTIPDAHYDVSMAAIAAGKHVYSEKPVVLTMAQGTALRDAAAAAGLSVGSAPDTFLGGAHQQVRALVDEGAIGTITAGAGAFMNHGMEHWHPWPHFFYQPGGGPMLDMGPYYLAALINLLGSVRRVGALASAALAERVVTSDKGHKGKVVPVNTPTNIHALLEFASGATVNLSTSWDVWAHKRVNLELYGTEGSIFVPDPNFFGGTIEIARRDGPVEAVTPWDHPLGVANQDHGGRMLANYRMAGVADMLAAIAEGREARCALARSLHAVEVMSAALESGRTGNFVTLTTTCTRPEALPPAAARALLA